MNTEHEIINLRAVALGLPFDLPAIPLPIGNGDPIRAKLGNHEVWIDGQTRPATLYDRAKLQAGDIIRGPAVITEMDATTLIEHDCVGTVDTVGNILITLSD